MKLSGIIIENKETGYFTGFIKEYRGVVAQAKSIEELKKKLYKTWENFLEYAKRLKIEYSEPTEV